MSMYKVPGAAIASIRQGKIDDIIGIGVRNLETCAHVGQDTVFETASISKPVFACAVLQLIDSGALSLSQPLAAHFPALIAKDARAAGISVSHVLAHMTGLPNWRSEHRPLRTYFEPGTRFSYSGEGYGLLQSVIEQVTGQSLDALMSRLVFGPIGMQRSSYLWQHQFEDDHAMPHDDRGNGMAKFRPTNAHAAFSLHSTAADLARFLQAVINGQVLSKRSQDLWLRSCAAVPEGCTEWLESTEPPLSKDIAWGLGWGLETRHRRFFHWGANPGFKAFVIGSQERGDAFIMLSNGDNGLKLAKEFADRMFSSPYPSLSWLGISDKAS